MRSQAAGRTAYAMLLMLCFVCACVFAACFPERAIASSVPYSIDQVRIDAQVQTDGAMRVVEHRVLSFASEGNEYRQLLPYLAKNSSVVISDMRVASADEDGNVAGEWTRLHPVAFQRDWRAGVSADELSALTAGGSYAYDATQYGFYLFFHADPQSRYVVELDYLIVNGAQAYADVADVTFKYINESSETSSSDVSFSISLPTPEDSAAVPGKDVFAWGHGPENGTVSNLGNTCIFTAEKVNQDQYAEAHVIFPASWLTHLTGAESRIHRDEIHLAWSIKAEKGWEDTFRHAAINDDKANIGLSLMALLLVVVSTAVLMRFRRNPAPTEDALTVEAARAALKELDPVLATRLLSAGIPSDKEFVVTILRLCDDGFLQLEDGAAGKRIVRSSFRLVEDSMGKRAIDVLSTLDASQTGVSAESMQESLPSNGEAFIAAVKEWRSASDELWRLGGFEDTEAATWARRLRIAGGAFAFVGLLTLLLTSCFAGGMLLIFACAGVFVVAHAVSRVTQKAVDRVASLEFARNLIDAGDDSVFGEEMHGSRTHDSRTHDLCTHDLCTEGSYEQGAYYRALRVYELGASSSNSSEVRILGFAEEIERSIPFAFKLSQRPASTVFSRVRGCALGISKKMRATCKKKNG